jgi:PAS domain S-box-containing protein
MKRLLKKEDDAAKQQQEEHLQLLESLRKSDLEKSVILDAITELVLYLDTNLKIIWVNKAVLTALNTRPRLLFRKFCYQALHGRTKPCRVCPARKTLENGEPNEVVDISSYGKDWVLRSYPVRDEHDTIIGIVVIVTDITERRKAEKALYQSEEKYRELYENANDIIFLIDSTGKIISCNAAMSNTYGLKQETLMGMEIEKLIDKDYIPGFKYFIQRKFGNLYDRNNQEFLTYSNTGDEVWIEVNARIIKENDKPVALHGIARDITDKKRMVKALHEKSQRLQDLITTLKTVMKQREEDKVEIEQSFIFNVRQSILPCIENLKLSYKENSNRMNQLKMLEKNISEVISPYLRSLSSKFPNLTPMEMKIIKFIKEGRTTKEISELLVVSSRTIDFHRKNIRKKLELKNRNANLRSFLSSI